MYCVAERPARRARTCLLFLVLGSRQVQSPALWLSMKGAALDILPEPLYPPVSFSKFVQILYGWLVFDARGQLFGAIAVGDETNSVCSERACSAMCATGRQGCIRRFLPPGLVLTAYIYICPAVVTSRARTTASRRLVFPCSPRSETCHVSNFATTILDLLSRPPLTAAVCSNCSSFDPGRMTPRLATTYCSLHALIYCSITVRPAEMRTARTLSCHKQLLFFMRFTFSLTV